MIDWVTWTKTEFFVRRGRTPFVVLALLVGLAAMVSAQTGDELGADAQATTPSPPVDPEFRLPEGVELGSGPVVLVDVSGTVDMGMSAYIRRAIEENPEASLIVLDVDTFGGRVDAAAAIRDSVLESTVPTLAYVDRRAISAGALISLAADYLVFAPGSSMGAATPVEISSGEATPVDEKHVSYMRAEMRATAEATGRDTDVAQAMVDARIVIDGYVDSESLLTVTAQEALALGIADGIEGTLDEVLEGAGVGDHAREEVTMNWAEQVARLLTSPWLSGILMTLALLGLMVELYSPGVGLPGAVGLICLVAFLFGHSVVALAGWEEIALLIVGILLIAVETFVIPGFGVAGIMGIVCIVASMVLALVGIPIGDAMELGTLNRAAMRVFLSVAVAIILIVAIAKMIPARALPNWLMLRTTISGTSESDTGATVAGRPRVGDLGVAITPLRPSGKAEFAGKAVDVTSELRFVDAGAQVRVVAVETMRTVVEPLSMEES